MPSFTDDADARIDQAIQEWKRIALNETNDIVGWRDAASDRYLYEGDPTRQWEDLDPDFNSLTVQLARWMATHHSSMDPTPLWDFYEAAVVWHEEHTARRLPRNEELGQKVERCIFLCHVMQAAIEARLISHVGSATSSGKPTAIPNGPGKELVFYWESEPYETQRKVWHIINCMWSEDKVALEDVCPKSGRKSSLT